MCSESESSAKAAFNVVKGCSHGASDSVWQVIYGVLGLPKAIVNVGMAVKDSFKEAADCNQSPLKKFAILQPVVQTYSKEMVSTMLDRWTCGQLAQEVDNRTRSLWNSINQKRQTVRDGLINSGTYVENDDSQVEGGLQRVLTNGEKQFLKNVQPPPDSHWACYTPEAKARFWCEGFYDVYLTYAGAGALSKLKGVDDIAGAARVSASGGAATDADLLAAKKATSLSRILQAPGQLAAAGAEDTASWMKTLGYDLDKSTPGVMTWRKGDSVLKFPISDNFYADMTAAEQAKFAQALKNGGSYTHPQAIDITPAMQKQALNHVLSTPGELAVARSEEAAQSMKRLGYQLDQSVPGETIWKNGKSVLKFPFSDNYFADMSPGEKAKFEQALRSGGSYTHPDVAKVAPVTSVGASASTAASAQVIKANSSISNIQQLDALVREQGIPAGMNYNNGSGKAFSELSLTGPDMNKMAFISPIADSPGNMLLRVTPETADAAKAALEKNGMKILSDTDARGMRNVTFQIPEGALKAQTGNAIKEIAHSVGVTFPNKEIPSIVSLQGAINSSSPGLVTQNLVTESRAVKDIGRTSLVHFGDKHLMTVGKSTFGESQYIVRISNSENVTAAGQATKVEDLLRSRGIRILRPPSQVGIGGLASELTVVIPPEMSAVDAGAAFRDAIAASGP